jgi:hypothetical protein
MSAPGHADLRDLVERQAADIARRVAAHPDRDGLAVQGPRDLIPAAVRAGLDLRWQPDGALHGRRSDAISTTFFVVADADGTADVALLRRWALERGAVPEGVALGDADWALVADAVVAIARRELAQAKRRWPTVRIAEAVARRFPGAWALRLDGDRLMGHERRLEPSATEIAEHREKLSRLSPINRRMQAGSGPRWPADREITADVLADYARTTTLVQSHEPTPDWAEVIAELRALVAHH